jgi:uncharacterized protein
MTSGGNARSAPEAMEPLIPTVDIVLPFENPRTTPRPRAPPPRPRRAPSRIGGVRLRKHSIDSRHRAIKVQLRLDVASTAHFPPDPVKPFGCPPLPAIRQNGHHRRLRPGRHVRRPALPGNGVKPILFERGKDASARRFDLAPLLREGRVIEDSNYCFGEGGAGTFSDGKLYTRATKRGPVARIYEILVAHGAPGTDPHRRPPAHRLQPAAQRGQGDAPVDPPAGGEVRFPNQGHRFPASPVHIHGVAPPMARKSRRCRDPRHRPLGARHLSPARPRNFLLEPKPFAVGFRIEHPQPFIDRANTTSRGQERPRLLPAARYRLATKSATAACIRSACAPAAGSCRPPPRTTRSSSMA